MSGSASSDDGTRQDREAVIRSTSDTLIAADRHLEETARTARIDLIVEVDRRAGPFDARLLSAVLEIPRERFVRPWDIAESAIDTPLLLDDEGLATISAPHAYLTLVQGPRSQAGRSPG